MPRPREELLSRGIEASELVSFGDQDGGTFFGFADPDGNTGAVQELKVRAQRPLVRSRRAGGSGPGDAAATGPCGFVFSLWTRSVVAGWARRPLDDEQAAEGRVPF